MNKMKETLLFLFKYLLQLATKENLKKIADHLLDLAEDLFPEGTTRDNLVEAVTQKIRNGFDIPDNDEKD